MDLSEQTTAHVGMPSDVSPAQNPITAKKRFRRFGSPGRAILLVVAFLAGIIVALMGVLTYFLFLAGDVHPLPSPPPSSSSALIGQVSAAFVTSVVRKNINAAGLPGEPQNVQVSLRHNGPMTVTSDVHLSMLGISTTRRLTVDLQPFISSCQVHIHVLHIDLQGFPLTLFAQTFEQKINQQMQVNVSGLPDGFTYCAINVHTEPGGLFVTYSAVSI
jgi:hypothetical protein